ncbi:hypothetical protein AVEN_50689-1 [Araneus ventricosus]|uniref:Uncharacterized protein n=1 Tax=Araneus ventricosus TaxID=182803 RepID=A0A4Y2M0Q4_ARAVE|nr:hypothetical protein AVEN_50689-1 [Araneus ventricosus]
MRALHLPEMGVMCVEYSFPCEGCLMGEPYFSRENGICSTLFKMSLCKINTRRIITRLKCLDTLHVIRMHFVFSENPPTAALHFESPVLDVAHSLQCPESLLIVADSWQIFESNLF